MIGVRQRFLGRLACQEAFLAVVRLSFFLRRKSNVAAVCAQAVRLGDSWVLVLGSEWVTPKRGLMSFREFKSNPK